MYALQQAIDEKEETGGASGAGEPGRGHSSQDSSSEVSVMYKSKCKTS